MTYLDNAATTKIHPEVLNEMIPYLTEEYGNVGGLYKLGENAKKAVELARERVSKFINAKPENIIFTSGGCEANSLAVSLCRTTRTLCPHGILTSEIEHDSILKAVQAHNRYLNLDISPLVTTNFGTVSVDEDKIRQVDMVSVMYENNETGVINDVWKIGRLCEKYGVVFHTDCVQAAGHLPLDVEKFKCSMMSISSHKIHGPKGVGALYVSDEVLPYLEPLIYGGLIKNGGNVVALRTLQELLDLEKLVKG